MIRTKNIFKFTKTVTRLVPGCTSCCVLTSVRRGQTVQVQIQMGAGICSAGPREDEEIPPIAYQQSPARPPKIPPITASSPDATTTTTAAAPAVLPPAAVLASSPLPQSAAPASNDKTDVAATTTLDEDSASPNPNETMKSNESASLTPGKWDDWDEEQDDDEQDKEQDKDQENSEAPTQQLSGTSTATTSSSSSTVSVITSTTAGSQIGVSLASSESMLHGPKSTASPPLLLCTKCDHKIFCSPGSRWSENVDYIFVRNYGGVNKKLKEELVVDSDCTAYCCQCCWQSITTSKEVSPWGTPAAPEGGSGASGENIFWSVTRS